jgi:SpoIID/LytB domain protein
LYRDDSSLDFKIFLGKLYYLNGEDYKAYKIFSRIKEKDWRVYLYLGLIFEDLNNENLALLNYLKSIDSKKNTIALYRIAKIYYKKKDYTKAKDYFLEVLNLDKSVRLINYYLADCFYKLGDYKSAYSYIDKAFSFYPENKSIKILYNLIKNRLGEEFFLKEKEKKEKSRLSVRLKSYRKKIGIPTISVGIAKNLDKISFFCGGDFIISDKNKKYECKKEKIYTLSLKNKFLFLIDYKEGTIISKFSLPVYIKSDNFPFYIFDVSYGKDNFWQKTIDMAYRGDFKIELLKDKLVLINILSIEEYLYGVVPAEINPNSPPEALKAQALLARTVAIKSLHRHKEEGFDVCSDIHCQVYKGFLSENPNTNKAVDSTFGEVLTFNGNLIYSFYHANSGGCLRSDRFFNEGYLLNKFETEKIYKSGYEEELWFSILPEGLYKDTSNFRWARIYDLEDFYIAFGYNLEELKKIIPTKKGDCFHYDEIEVITSKGRTKYVKDQIRDYFDKLKSLAFKVEIKFSKEHKPKMLFFFGAGFGHCSGLSQEGAIYMANNGLNYKEIINNYYNNCKIEKYY